MQRTKQQENWKRKNGTLIFSTLVRPVFLHKYFQPAWMRTRKRNPRLKHKPNHHLPHFITMSNKSQTAGTISRTRSQTNVPRTSLSETHPNLANIQTRQSATRTDDATGRANSGPVKAKRGPPAKREGKGPKASTVEQDQAPPMAETAGGNPKTPDMSINSPEREGKKESPKKEMPTKEKEYTIGPLAETATGTSNEGVDGPSVDHGDATDVEDDGTTTPVAQNGTARLQKRKSETDDDGDAFIPGQNQFMPLFAHITPPAKKAKGNLSTDDEGMDLDADTHPVQVRA
ncbi:hypothetical protein ARMSODRAFT_652729 [Armillaria solidipes]|uniref:Uncharacterized protein n=1 Tax=Armillaria solidipes TaxID=1076256 RepID=A0A2H3BTT0_9AGAR|nr:hypothetical protein ARMSODRAFT_365899 [Armillaria solidipes]PBK73883.1 hypothetical protein ARMSODRAFT_652729 [Armillaria solidipes]